MRIEDVLQKDMLQRIRGEFVEMPGLRLTAAQAQRLWGLERPTCEELLRKLVNDNFLSQTRDGSFIRTDGGPQRMPRSAA
jgi:Fic family protein